VETEVLRLQRDEPQEGKTADCSPERVTVQGEGEGENADAKGAKPWSLHKRGSKPTIAGMDPLLLSGRDQRNPG